MRSDSFIANGDIRARKVILIDDQGTNSGELDLRIALTRAAETGLDLVQVGIDARSQFPVCKIMDFGKYKYEQSLKDRKSRSTSKVPQMKQVRFGRSIKIDPHDVQIRIDQSRRLLEEGHRVQIVQRMQGREMAHKEMGLKNLQTAISQLSDVAKVEQQPRWVSNEASIILAPTKKSKD